MDRRQFNSTVSAGLAGMLAAGKPAYGFATKPTKLRVLGTHVTLQEDLRLRAQKELGLDIEFEPGGSAAVLHKASTKPESFDLYEQWSNSLNVLWQAGSIQGIETERLSNWSEVNSLTKTGKLTEKAHLGAGDAPYELLYAQEDGSLGSAETGQISFLPYVHNVDSFGYNSDVVPQGIPYETESWGWLLDERWHGKVALVNAPTIGLFDAVLATQALGLVEYADIGNLTRQEIDKLFEVLIDYRQRGHFRGVWSSVPQSAELMTSGEVVIQSMFSPGVSMVNGSGMPCIYAAPKEGYRAWHGVMCLSVATEGAAKTAAYEYMNWWLSGWPGAFIARQGYYISNPQRSRPLLSEAEWDYWYEGKPAAEDLRGTDGRISVKQGQTRTGGSYEQRFSNVAVWNTVMDTYEYSLLRWNDFLLAA